MSEPGQSSAQTPSAALSIQITVKSFLGKHDLKKWLLLLWEGEEKGNTEAKKIYTPILMLKKCDGVAALYRTSDALA